MDWRLFPPSTTAAQLCGLQGGGWGGDTSPVDSFWGELPEGWSPAGTWEATQEMGDVMLVPPGWWYQVRLDDRCLAVVGQYATRGTLPLVEAEVALKLGDCAAAGLYYMRCNAII